MLAVQKMKAALQICSCCRTEKVQCSLHHGERFVMLYACHACCISACLCVLLTVATVVTLLCRGESLGTLRPGTTAGTRRGIRIEDETT